MIWLTLFLSSLASVWPTSSTTSTSRPPLVPEGRPTRRVASWGTIGWVCLYLPASAALLLFFPGLVTTCAASPALCAAADRLRRVLQDAEGPNWTRSPAVRPLRAQDGSDTGAAVPSITLFTQCRGRTTMIWGQMNWFFLTNLSLVFPERQEMKQARVQHCNQMSYSSGAPTLLASTGNEWIPFGNCFVHFYLTCFPKMRWWLCSMKHEAQSECGVVILPVSPLQTLNKSLN